MAPCNGPASPVTPCSAGDRQHAGAGRVSGPGRGTAHRGPTWSWRRPRRTPRTPRLRRDLRPRPRASERRDRPGRHDEAPTLVAAVAGTADGCDLVAGLSASEPDHPGGHRRGAVPVAAPAGSRGPDRRVGHGPGRDGRQGLDAPASTGRRGRCPRHRRAARWLQLPERAHDHVRRPVRLPGVSRVHAYPAGMAARARHGPARRSRRVRRAESRVPGASLVHRRDRVLPPRDQLPARADPPVPRVEGTRHAENSRDRFGKRNRRTERGRSSDDRDLEPGRGSADRAPSRWQRRRHQPDPRAPWCPRRGPRAGRRGRGARDRSARGRGRRRCRRGRRW